MANLKASDNPFPSILIEEGTEPTAPAAGHQRLYIDSTTHVGMIVDSTGTQTPLGGDVSAHIADTTDAHDASAISFTPAGTIAATDVQAAIEEVASEAGGGFSHAYIGYNTIGGSTEGVTAFRWFIKKVTLASAGYIASIGVYLDNVTNGNVIAINAAVFEDNAGTPRYVLAGNTSTQEFWLDHDSSATPGDPRWVHIPVGFYAAAGDYWIGVGLNCTTNSYNVYKDGSGADRYFTPAANRIVDAGQVTVTTTTDRYSIRASLLT